MDKEYADKAVPIWMTTAEVAEYFGVSLMSVRRWVKAKKLVGYQPSGRNYKFKTEEVERLIKASSSAGDDG